MLKNRECWTRFLSLPGEGEATCLAPPEGGGNRPSRVLLCRSVAELGGAHSLFRCVPIIRRDRWPPGLVTSIYNSSQHRLNDVGLRLRNGLREFNGPIPATTDRKVRRKNSRITISRPTRLRKMATAWQARPPLQPHCYFSLASLSAGTPFWPLGG
jgi:hypothetical protein